MGIIKGRGLSNARTTKPNAATRDPFNAQAAVKTIRVIRAPCWTSIAMATRPRRAPASANLAERARTQGKQPNAGHADPGDSGHRHCQDGGVPEAVQLAHLVEVWRARVESFPRLHEDAPVERDAAGRDEAPPVGGQRRRDGNGDEYWPPSRPRGEGWQQAIHQSVGSDAHESRPGDGHWIERQPTGEAQHRQWTDLQLPTPNTNLLGRGHDAYSQPVHSRDGADWDRAAD